MILKPDGKWSVKDHVGHLFVLEPLWRQRILDIQSGAQQLTVADLNNTATSSADFNSVKIDDLLRTFIQERSQTIALLNNINIVEFKQKSYHPRLHQTMGIVDHLYFVAEHDNHHVEYIKAFLASLA